MKKIIWPDVLLVLGFVLYLGVGFCTRVIISKVASVTLYAEQALQLEANPLARKAMEFKYGLAVAQWGSISIFSGLYYFMRRRWSKSVGHDKEMYYNQLAIFTIGLFMVFLQNLFNDLPILLGMMMAGG